ncbi:helix-turn-helix domain-containing protein [Ascidiaceihabitans sp.]|uniref:GlxA family transcriptional regulator n=1 Tax=Ascidiaceihabitans sp. TaxID=1872644 RepID=UPI003298D288
MAYTHPNLTTPKPPSPSRPTSTRRVAILGFDAVLMMDIAGPAQVFGCANTILSYPAYSLSVVTRDGADPVTDTGLTIGTSDSFATMRASKSDWDDIVVPGGPGVDAILYDAHLQSFIRNMAHRANRVLSICSGSLLTAAAGLLDGRSATSHWERSAQAQNLFPQVHWHMDRIYTSDGKFHCSAGVTAGIDLTLAMLEADHGRKLALDVAREMVVFLHRHGGQSQYSHPLKAQSASNQKLGGLYAKIEAEPARNWTVSAMAHSVGTTERTLHRAFVRDTRKSPSQFVQDRRLGIARSYLEHSAMPIKDVARQAGFGDSQSMRRCFQNLLGITPTDYQRRFGVDPQGRESPGSE